MTERLVVILASISVWPYIELTLSNLPDRYSCIEEVVLIILSCVIVDKELYMYKVSKSYSSPSYQ